MPDDRSARHVRGLFLTASILIVLVLISVAVGAWYLLSTRAPRTQLESDLLAARAALQAKPQDPIAHEDMSHVYVRMGREDSAIEEMKEAVRLAPDNPRILNNMALLYGRYGMHDEAIVAAKNAIEVYKQSAPAYSVMGQSYYALGDLTEAHKALEEAVRLEPVDADSRFALGTVLLDLGKRDEAAEHFKTVKSQLADYPGIDEALAKAGVEASDITK